jgi:hypothetical protein
MHHLKFYWNKSLEDDIEIDNEKENLFPFHFGVLPSPISSFSCGRSRRGSLFKNKNEPDPRR